MLAGRKERDGFVFVKARRRRRTYVVDSSWPAPAERAAAPRP